MIPPRIPLALLPTPIHPLPNVSHDFGIDLWIKRDDLTGFAMGGNKGRKLEYLMADVLAKRAEVVVTCGASQSNFVRQLGAACSLFGIRCAAAVMDLPYDASTGKPERSKSISKSGNLLLDEILGVELHQIPDGTWEDLYAHARKVAEAYRIEGKNVFEIPIGGSSPLGAYSFMIAAEEVDRAGKFDWIVTASSSGSTYTGLAYAFHGSASRVVGISCDPEREVVDEIAALAEGLDELTGFGRQLAAQYLDIRFDYVGPGYGVPSDEGNASIQYVARAEGIFLDPIYSGKAFAGLTKMVRSREIRGRVLFWHTGGTPSLF